MRLLTFVEQGANVPTCRRVGALVDGQVLDVADLGLAGRPLPADLRGVIEAGSELWVELAERLARDAGSASRRPLADVALAAPVQPSKIVAIGRNYVEHSREQAAEPPDHPIIFAKYPTSVTGPGDEIRWDPALAAKVDWEAELAVVIGRPARRVKAAAAYDYVFGYTVANDVTARDLQRYDGQWVRGKSLDTFCPLGPWIVTKDEVPEPHGLPIRCRVNGEVMQEATTDDLIFRIPALIEFITAAFTLLPGDLILTGTPSGVGAYRNPPRFLRDGDEVTVEVEGIGAISNQCRTER